MKIIRSSNFQTDAEWLMDNFWEAIGQKKMIPQSFGLNHSSFDTTRIDALISAIESTSRPRSHFPNMLQRFPFTWSQWLRNSVLKIYELLFREQRKINMSLAFVLREIRSYNKKIAEQLMQQQITMGNKLEGLMDEQRKIKSLVSKLTEKYPSH